jgi:hypothetical protein
MDCTHHKGTKTQGSEKEESMDGNTAWKIQIEAVFSQMFSSINGFILELTILALIFMSLCLCG